MLRPRDEGSGGRDGIVLNMTMSVEGMNAVYSVQALIGKSMQPYMLSVDTGSSDLWLASSSCSSSSCSSAHTTLYDPSDSSQTGLDLTVNYLQGSVSGPIVWDAFQLGPYAIPSQALVAADTVTSESLSSDFVGLLGLALPPNSQIAQRIPPTESDEPDGATVQQNVFGLTPVETAPEQRFFSLSLERPGSRRIPSLLGIGRHPANLVPGFDPSKISFADLTPSSQGDTFWRLPVESIDAWIDGVQKPISLSRSLAVPTSVFPIALVDTGGAVILANPDIANGIYGAWSLGPGSDGNYYVSCQLPLNISITLRGLPPIPLHPLDITSLPQTTKSSDSTTCVGQIQASGALAPSADIVLGVPFLRNVYTVLSSSSSDNLTTSTQGSSFPRLGLLPLTDPTTAMSEFHQVRVLGQPLDPSASSTDSPNNSSNLTVGKKLPVGITVLVCIIGFFVACGALFGLRWWVLRRRFKRSEQVEHPENWGDPKRSCDAEPDEDTLRTKRWEEGKKRGLFYAESSTGSEWTRVEQAWAHEEQRQKKDEENARAKSRSRSRSPSASWISDAGHTRGGREEVPVPDVDAWGKISPTLHVRTQSELAVGGAAAVVPLLEEGERSPWSADAGTPPAHERTPSTLSVSFIPDEFGMAGVGARSSTASSSVRPISSVSMRPVSSGSVRPGSRPRGARAPSGGSVSSTTWRAEVGQVLEQVDAPGSIEQERG